MGNGRWLGRSSGSGSGGDLVWVRALAAVFVLLSAGSVLLGSGSHRYAQNALAPVPAPPIPTFSKPFLHTKPDAQALLAQLPLIFEPNQGQVDSRVKFLARGAGYSLFLDATDAVLAMEAAHSSGPGPSEQFLRMKLVGANPAAVTAGADPLPGKSNYLVGNDSSQWRRSIPQFAGVHYDSVYPGIDLVFYGNQGHLEYDFRVAPGADPSQAELQFDGATKLKLSEGDLILTGLTQAGKNGKDGGMRLQAPHVYQRDGDRRQQPVAGRFVLRSGNRVGFEIGSYDHRRELIIDPVLVFSTYFGGGGSETLPSVTVDGAGNIYLVGSTTSPQDTFSAFGKTIQTSIPSTLQITTTGPSHIFVAKINPLQPPSVVYETFLGGNGTDTSIGIAVDNGGNAYLVGNTSSTNFPTNPTNILGYQTVPLAKTQCTASPTCTSVFVSALDAVGSGLNYSSYLSGNGDDQASGMTIDLNQDVFITGTTTSNNTPSSSSNLAFPASNLITPYQAAPKPGSTIQFFVTKISTTVPSVGGVAYSTYFGGSTPAGAIATGGGIAVDTTGNIYFTGTTNFYNSGSGVYGDSGQTEDFPILNAYQPCLDTPPPTILSNPNPCTAPTTPYPTDAFVAKLNPNAVQTGSAQLLFSTYLGGTGTDSGPGIAIDSGAANIYLTGSTNSSDFIIPTGVAPFQACLDTPPVTPPVVTCPTIASPAPSDAYVARISNPTLSTTGTPNDVALTYFSYLGGSGNDSGAAIAVLDSLSTTLDDVVVTGSTSSTNFPVTTGAIQSNLNGAQNAFFAQIDTTTVTGQSGQASYVTYFGGNGVDRGTSIAVDPNLNSYFVGDTTSTNLQTDNPLQTTLAAGATRNAFVVKLGTATALSMTCVSPCVSPTGVVSAGNQVTITFTVTNEGPDPAISTNVSGTVPAGVTLDSATAGSGSCSTPANNEVICQIATLQAGSTAPITLVVTPVNAGSFQATAQIFNVNNTSTNITASAAFEASSFSVFILPSAQTVAAGSPATYTVQVSPTNGAYGANVSLSCSSLPTGAACNFANSTLTPLSGSASTTLNLTTTPQPTNTITSVGWRHPLYAFWLMVPGMALLSLGAGGKRRRRWLGLLMLCLLFALILLQPSCSSGKTQPTASGTPSGIYPLTLTATSGSFSQSAVFSLTVTP
jgi:uncharacterized repeat protein (TIGR01451 family)